MLRAVALVPSPPLLVPELTGRAAQEVEPVRSAASTAAGHLAGAATRWLVVGTGERSARVRSDALGTFAGFGVDVRVALSPSADRTEPDMALAALIAGWLRGAYADRAEADVYVVDRDMAARECLDLGRGLRAEMDAVDEDWGLLVVADGATTLTAKAPGSFDQRGEAVQNRIDDALGTADVDALAALDGELCSAVGVSGTAAWQTLAGIVGDDRMRTRTLYRAAPFGVGYFVGVWEPMS